MGLAQFSLFFIFLSVLQILNLFIALLLSAFAEYGLRPKPQSTIRQVVHQLKNVINFVKKTRKVEPAILHAHDNPACDDVIDEEKQANERSDKNKGKKRPIFVATYLRSIYLSLCLIFLYISLPTYLPSF